MRLTNADKHLLSYALTIAIERYEALAVGPLAAYYAQRAREAHALLARLADAGW